MRLIDADKLKEQDFGDNYYVIKAEIDKAPTIQAVPIEVLQEIRQEIEKRRKNSGGEPNRELAFNVCLKIIDSHISVIANELVDEND